MFCAGKTSRRRADGTACPTLADARAHAVKIAGDFAKNRPREGRTGRAICVTDEAGMQLFRVPLRGRRRNP